MISLFFPLGKRALSRHDDESLACPGTLARPGLLHLPQGNALKRAYRCYSSFFGYGSGDSRRRSIYRSWCLIAAARSISASRSS